MKKRVKLFTTIASLCLAVALMAFGVYAAANVTYNVNGTVSYVMTDVLVTVKTELKAAAKSDNAAGMDLAGLADLSYSPIAFSKGDARTEYTFDTVDEATGKVDATKTDEAIKLEGVAYDFTRTSVYQLTINVKTVNDAGVTVTPTVPTVAEKENYYVVASISAATPVAKATTAGQDFVFYIAIKDVTKQITGTALNFALQMVQTPAQQG